MAALTAFSPNTTILSADTNGNNTTIRSTYNAHDIATSSVHGITSPSLIVGSNEVQTLINKSIYSTYDIKNLSLTQAAGALTFKGGDGLTALSSTNKAFIPIPSVTAGKIYEMPVTSNIVINDLASGSSNLVGIKFGIIDTVNWAEDMLWYIGAVNKSDSDLTGSDGASAYFLTRNPTLATTPAATYIGKFGTNPTTDDQLAIVLCGTGYTTANYASLPCRIIGSIRVRYTAASTDWTIQTLAFSDGIGQFNESKDLIMPPGQNGATSGKYLADNGGTAPVFSTNQYYWRQSVDGRVHLSVYLTGDAGTDGAGAVPTQVTIPLYPNNTITNQVLSGSCRLATPTEVFIAIGTFIGAGAGNLRLQINTTSGTNLQTSIQNVTNSMFPGGSRDIYISGSYRAF